MGLGPGWVSESRDDVSESEKATVDRDTLLDTVTLSGGTFQLVHPK